VNVDRNKLVVSNNQQLDKLRFIPYLK